MRTPHQRPKRTARSAGIGLAALLIAGLVAVAGPSLASTQPADGHGMSGMDMSEGHASDMDMTATPMRSHAAPIDLTSLFGSQVGDALVPAPAARR
jgi:hypothetical protein